MRISQLRAVLSTVVLSALAVTALAAPAAAARETTTVYLTGEVVDYQGKCVSIRTNEGKLVSDIFRLNTDRLGVRLPIGAWVGLRGNVTASGVTGCVNNRMFNAEALLWPTLPGTGSSFPKTLDPHGPTSPQVRTGTVREGLEGCKYLDTVTSTYSIYGDTGAVGGGSAAALGGTVQPAPGPNTITICGRYPSLNTTTVVWSYSE